jgi:hypothetical protein
MGQIYLISEGLTREAGQSWDAQNFMQFDETPAVMQFYG